MITKERLEELIEQGALIFYILNNSVALLRLNNSYGISTEEYNKEHNCKPQFYHSGYVYQNICDADKIFESEEDARWELEMTETRMETLKLPTWEEFITNDKYNYYGSSYFSFDNYRLIVKLPSEDDDCEFIGIDIDGNTEIYNWEEATKENYIEACKLCLRLFKGEEV